SLLAAIGLIQVGTFGLVDDAQSHLGGAVGLAQRDAGPTLQIGLGWQIVGVGGNLQIQGQHNLVLTLALVLVGAFMMVIGLDNALYQRVAYHVLAQELGEANALDAVQH